MNKKTEQAYSPAQKNTALLAISGGLDSICLLHLLCLGMQNRLPENPTNLESLIKDFLHQNPIQKIELAYIDHCQRDDTQKDLSAINSLSKHLGSNLKLHMVKLNLPAKVSEDLARKARYKALEELKQENHLGHIITAHHSDDLIETALINLIRGTGPKGLSSLSHQPESIWRPLIYKTSLGIYVFKKDLEEYALKNNLKWHEDSTNSSPLYLRNRLRAKLKSSTPESDLKLKLLEIIKNSSNNKAEFEKLLAKLELSIQKGKNCYSRPIFSELTSEVQKAFLHLKLSKFGYDVNRKSVELARDFVLNKQKGKILQLKGCEIHIKDKQTFCFVPLLKSSIIST